MFRAKVYGVAGFEREFAVKRFHSQFVSAPEIAAAIAGAARTYGSLEHPRIARLHEYGIAGGETFTATELIHGIDVARLLSMTLGSGQTLPPGAAVFLISQAARAVGYAHGRSVSHLGLCPTNVVATPDGDVKITDFCLLPTRLPDRPGEDFSLHARMPYLAPEQLVGEPTSPATDVYQLGVIACELLTGKAPFPGPTSPDIARKILASELPRLELPAPLTTVLLRCLERSPFERYPDARALADALDAAAREADLPGGQRELGASVRELMARASDMNDSHNSGAVSFPMPAPPSPHLTYPSSRASRASATAPPARVGVETVPMPTLELGSGPGGMPRLAEPPPRATTAAGKPRPTTAAGKSGRLRGASQPALPPLTLQDKLRGNSHAEGPEDETEATEIGYLEEEAPTTVRSRDIGFVSVSDAGQTAGNAQHGLGEPETLPGPTLGAEPEPGRFGSLPPDQAAASTMPLAVPLQPPAPRPVIPAPPQASRPPLPAARPPLPPLPSAAARPAPPAPALRPPLRPDTPALLDAESVHGPETVPARPGAVGPNRLRAASAHPEQDFTGLKTLDPGGSPTSTAPHASETAPDDEREAGLVNRPPEGMPLPSPPDSLILRLTKLSDSELEAGQLPEDPSASPAATARRPWKWLAAVALLCGLGGGGYLLHDRVLSGPDPAVQGTEPPERQASGQDPAPGPAAARDPDTAGRAATGAAGEEEEPEADDDGAGSKTAGTSDKLTIRSKPSGARVYLDGSPLGKTPLTLDATTDRHRLALILPGHKLHAADIEGHGAIDVSLAEVSPPAGPAGIKVRCRKKNRYYVFIDGHDTGQLCPSERIGVDVGAHTLEVYDPISDSRQEFRVNVESTHRSMRVRVD